jgi:alkanesulfonate monooxygenase SsuD/methylene tetrahydromethanopterin reductase-like flavin-dependent oxidoreductase (luciferase family)
MPGTTDVGHPSADLCISSPRPRQCIPVWFGGYAEATLRRVARAGDGWMPGHGHPDDAAHGQVNRLREYAQAAGRAPQDIGLEPRLNLA